MRIVIYTANRDVPFTTVYDQLGSPDRIIFSNCQDKITDFNNESVDELIYLVEPWLPRKETIGSKEDDTIFYIPFEMKEKFMEIIKHLMSFFKGMMGKGQTTTSIPTSQQLGLGKGSSLATFYDEMEIQEVNTVMSKKEDLVKLFDGIINEDNEIDAVFVYSDEESMIVAQSNPGTDAKRQVDISTFDGVLGGLTTHKITEGERAGLGLLEHRTYHFSEGILNVTILEEGAGKYLLCFVSSTPKGLGEMLMYRRKNMAQLVEKLDTILA